MALRFCASLEVGLLAVALTPVIVMGGIDLSVGSLMGLSAIVLGKLWCDAHLPMSLAIAGTLVLGMAAGWLKRALDHATAYSATDRDARFILAFRGLAEGITQAVDNFTGFGESFIALGKGDLFGQMPIQLLVFVPLAIGYWVLLHRTSIGGLMAIGFTAEGTGAMSALPSRGG